MTYTNRDFENFTVEKVEFPEGATHGAVNLNNGLSFLVKSQYEALFYVGLEFTLETRNYQVAGFTIAGVEYDRVSDEQFEEEHRALLKKIEQSKINMLNANRETWLAEEKALPDWIRARVESFHEMGGENFELDGWGYELIIARLAVEYYKLGDVILDKDIFEINQYESDLIKAISREHGTSGNQHSAALSLAKIHLKEPEYSLATTVSALTPLTGDPFYVGKDADTDA